MDSIPIDPFGGRSIGLLSPINHKFAKNPIPDHVTIKGGLEYK